MKVTVTLSSLLRVKSLAPAHSLLSTSGGGKKKRKIRHAVIQLQQKPRKKKKSTGVVVAPQLMQKLSASPKSQYSPRCCTVQMAGVSAYQSECYHGGREKKKLQLYMYLLFVPCWVTVFWLLLSLPPSPPTYFPTKNYQGAGSSHAEVGKTCTLGIGQAWNSNRRISFRPLCGPRLNLPVLASRNTTSGLSSTSEAWIVNKTLKKKKKKKKKNL